MFAAWNQLTLLSYSFFGLPWLIACFFFLPKEAFIKPVWFYVALFSAFVLARTLGMSLNRLIDVKIDAKNPRTSKRPLQMKWVRKREVAFVIVVTTLLFVFSCYLLSPLAFFLSPLALVVLYIYSYTKRVTLFCHTVLGCTHLLLPLFVFAAFLDTLPLVAYLLGVAQGLFVCGNDMIYACSDITFDQREKLYSLPSRLGIPSTFWIARACQLFALVSLCWLGVEASLSWVYFLGIGCMALLYLRGYMTLEDKYESFLSYNTKGGALFLLFLCLENISTKSF